MSLEQWIAAIVPLLTAIGAFLHSMHTRAIVRGGKRK